MDMFGYFRQICTIPRESGNEEGMRQYLLSWARENGFEGLRDEAGNIIVRTGATAGFEDRPYTALQAHMDMVCVKVQTRYAGYYPAPLCRPSRPGKK